jgi:peroxiredoxin
MKKCFLLLPSAVLSLAAEPAAPVPPAPGAKVTDFSAKDVNGRRQSLSDYRSNKATVVVIIGTECPVSNLYVVTLSEMYRKYSEKGVQFLAINSNDHDTFAEVVAHAKERKLPFPVLKDEDQSAADALGALRTPEAFLLDPDRVIRYHGRIDDQYGVSYRRASPSKTELKDAIEELLAGKPVTVSESKLQGCYIGRTKKAANRPPKS